MNGWCHRDDHVGEEEVDVLAAVFDGFNGFGSVGGGQDVVAVSGQDAAGDFAEGCFVLDDEDGFAAVAAGCGRGGLFGWGGLVDAYLDGTWKAT
jgi:hypothetical protein